MIVISAAPFEAAPLLDSALKSQLTYHACGIGALPAARAADHLAEVCRREDVVFIGTCGIFSAFSAPQVYLATSVHWLPPCVRAGIAYKIAHSDPPIALTKAASWAHDFKKIQVLGASTIALTNQLPGEFQPETSAENLELYSLAEAVQSAAKSFTALLATTNQIGPQAHEQWRRNHTLAAELTARTIIEKLGVL